MEPGLATWGIDTVEALPGLYDSRTQGVAAFQKTPPWRHSQVGGASRAWCLHRGQLWIKNMDGHLSPLLQLALGGSKSPKPGESEAL